VTTHDWITNGWYGSCEDMSKKWINQYSILWCSIAGDTQVNSHTKNVMSCHVKCRVLHGLLTPLVTCNVVHVSWYPTHDWSCDGCDGNPPYGYLMQRCTKVNMQNLPAGGCHAMLTKGGQRQRGDPLVHVNYRQHMFWNVACLIKAHQVPQKAAKAFGAPKLCAASCSRVLSS
jgi:hypothetical protein